MKPNPLNSLPALRGILFVLMMILLGSAPCGAAHYPSPRDRYLNDFAGVLAPADAENIRARLEALDRQTGLEGTVVTVASLSDFGTNPAEFETFATGLFNAWGVGHPARNDGFLVLLAVHDHLCRIELGKGFGTRFNARMQAIVDQTMVPSFRSGDVARGITEGTIAIIESLTKPESWFARYPWHLCAGAAIVLCLVAGISCLRSGRTGWGYAFFSAAAILLWFLLRSLGKAQSNSGNRKGFGGGRSSGRGGASGNW